jgi:hypothetical protein
MTTVFCTNCGKASKASAKFCMDCGSEISRPNKASATIASKAKNPSPNIASQKRKPTQSKTSGATKASKKRKPTPKADTSGKWIFAAILAPIILIVVFGFFLVLSEGSVSSPTQSQNNSVTQAPSDPNQSESDTGDANQESTVEEITPESALEACIEYGSLAASTAGYECPPSARTIKEGLVSALAYYCDMPAQAALNESSWTVMNPSAEDGIYTLQSITAMGRILWFIVDTRNTEYAEIYPNSSDAELYLEDWRCLQPGPYVVLKS